MVPDNIQYSGKRDRGIVVVNGLKSRGRRLGADVFEQVRSHVPLDLVGMQSETLGGLGEISHNALPQFMVQYRFFFNPIRYTSLGLAICEAMMLGMPIVGLATTELATVIENGVSGYVDTNVDRLIEAMRSLIQNPQDAVQLSQGARRTAQERFNMGRFTRDWNRAFALVTSTPTPDSPALVGGKI
jgi:glycosyltransferase involved in cell wall biosynthesis